MKTAKRTRQVFLTYTTSDTFRTPELLRVYSKSSYQAAYNWLANIAERYGQRFPTTGTGKVAVETVNPNNGQRWWIERHEVV